MQSSPLFALAPITIALTCIFAARDAHADEDDMKLAISAGPSFVAAPNSESYLGAGGGVEVDFNRRFALRAYAIWFDPFDPNDNSSTTNASPRNETRFDLLGEFGWTFARTRYGALSLFGGSGVVSSRPIARIDPRRTFDPKPKLAAVVGLASRFALADGIALDLRARAIAYNEQWENGAIATGAAAADRSTWYANDEHATPAFDLDLAITFVLPVTR